MYVKVVKSVQLYKQVNQARTVGKNGKRCNLYALETFSNFEMVVLVNLMCFGIFFNKK